MEKVRLGDVCTIKGGYAFKSEMFTTEGIPIIRIGNITKDGLVIDNDVCYEEEFWEANDNYRIRKNDILIAMSGATVGKSCINNNKRKLLLNQRVASINCYDTTNLKYIFYSIDSENFAKYVLKNSMGCAQPNISLKQISDFEIPLIPIEEQKGIANELDKITDLIDKRKEQLKKLDELVKARFVELFGDPKLNNKGWESGILADYFEVKGGKRIPKGMGYSDTRTNHPYLRATDMKNETILEDDIHYISEEVFQHIKRYTVNGGDIYLTNVGVNLGMAGVIPQKFDGASLTENAVKLVPKTEKILDGLFLAHYINSPGIQDYINERKMAVGVPKLAIFRIETMPLLIPPMEVQQDFIAFIKQTDKSKLEIQKGLKKLELMKKALMQKYFG